MPKLRKFNSGWADPGFDVGGRTRKPKDNLNPWATQDSSGGVSGQAPTGSGRTMQGGFNRSPSTMQFQPPNTLSGGMYSNTPFDENIGLPPLNPVGTGRGLSGGTGTGGIISQLGGGKGITRENPPAGGIIPPKYPEELGPGVLPPLNPTKPPTGKDWGTWSPQGGMAGTGWNPNWSIVAPQGADEESTKKREAAYFLGWFNNVLPYLSPTDMAGFTQVVQQNLDSLDDKDAYNYFTKLMAGTSGRTQWPSSASTYWDWDRMNELYKASTGYWENLYGDKDIGEWDPEAQKITRLFNALLGHQGTDMQFPGIWTQDQPMTRRQRQSYWDTFGNMTSGLEGTPYESLITAAFNPATSGPMLLGGIGMPYRSTNLPSTSNRYGVYQNQRWL